ncbi:Proteinase inhibitor [Trema orientale]|uniref:Proteinase inhibitor n=1 Tax=Trema orientale TaxID=63057 RepID=A0A2P5FBA1_TREOI|nr:Proteinase inhibitor [Trema orientale]
MTNRQVPRAYAGKKSWPELVGVSGEIAAAKTEKENPDVHAIVCDAGDLRCHRVWVWVNAHGLVTLSLASASEAHFKGLVASR